MLSQQNRHVKRVNQTDMFHSQYQFVRLSYSKICKSNYIKGRLGYYLVCRAAL